MTDNKKILSIVNNIIERTKDGSLQWRGIKNFISEGNSEHFVSELRLAEIHLEYDRLWVLDRNSRRSIAEVQYTGGKFQEPDIPSLYELVFEKVFRVQERLDDIEKILGSADDTANQSLKSGEENSSEDLPF